MNSVLIADSDGRVVTGSRNLESEMEPAVLVRLAKLESHVEHIQTDVADMKVDLRRVDAKLDGIQKDLSGKIERLDGKIDGMRTDLTGKIDGIQKDLSGKIERLDGKIEGVRTDLNGKIDGVRTDLTAKIDGVRTDLTAKIDKLADAINDLSQAVASMKVWTITLYAGLAASLLYVMAKGFKWL
jgi:chromosome segregation ATPase